MKHSLFFKLFTGVFLILCLFSCTEDSAYPSQDQLDSEKEKIQKLTHEWFEAERNKNIKTSLSYLAPDAIIQSEGTSTIKGIDDARNLYNNFFEIPYTDIKEFPRTVRMAKSGELAYDYGEWSMIIKQADSTVEERGKSTIIWEKRNGEWKAVLMSFSMNSK